MTLDELKLKHPVGSTITFNSDDSINVVVKGFDSEQDAMILGVGDEEEVVPCFIFDRFEAQGSSYVLR